MSDRIRAFATAAVFTSAVLCSHAAHARQWYIYSASRNTCLRATDFARLMRVPEAVSPGAWDDAMRSIDRMPTLDVVRDSEGVVSAVGVTIKLPTGDKTTMIWFVERATCDSFAASLRARGLAAAPDEMR